MTTARPLPETVQTIDDLEQYIEAVISDAGGDTDGIMGTLVTAVCEFIDRNDVGCDWEALPVMLAGVGTHPHRYYSAGEEILVEILRRYALVTRS